MTYNFFMPVTGRINDKDDYVNELVKLSADLEGGDTLIVYNFGNDTSQVVYIDKDSDYGKEDNIDLWNMVRIYTYKDGELIDDTEDIHVESLYEELERICEYRDLCLVG